LDSYLAQPENVRTLFIALNDEAFVIRELAVSIIGRLNVRNPAFVMPSLRKTLIQLLTELEYSGMRFVRFFIAIVIYPLILFPLILFPSNIRQNKEESARLLSRFISASHKLIKPYVHPIFEILYPNIKDSSPAVASQVISALGQLAQVGGEELFPKVAKLLPSLIEILQDQSSANKREACLRAIGNCASGSGYVIKPYTNHPELLDILLKTLRTEQSSAMKRDVLKVLGILGAVDPYKHQVGGRLMSWKFLPNREDVDTFELAEFQSATR
jgi:FKBP12-rapamycin complex-associated protein